MGAGEPYGEMRPEWSQRGPGWTRYGLTGNPTLLRALSNDLQTILSELALPLACVRRLDKRAEKGPNFSYTFPWPLGVFSDLKKDPIGPCFLHWLSPYTTGQTTRYQAPFSWGLRGIVVGNLRCIPQTER